MASPHKRRRRQERTPGRPAPGLDKRWQERWLAYCRVAEASGGQLSIPVVRRLRRRIRPILVHLDLVRATLDERRFDKVRERLQDRQKALGKLRDAQRQFQEVRKALDLYPEMKALGHHLKRRKRRFKRAARKALRGRILTEAIARQIGRSHEVLGRGAYGTLRRKALASARSDAIARAGGAHALTDPHGKAFHHARMAIKHYLDLASLLGCPEAGERLQSIDDLQSLMGRIHDIDLLVTRMDKFAARTKSVEPHYTAYGRALASRRVELLLAFYTLVGRLFQPKRALRAVPRKHSR